MTHGSAPLLRSDTSPPDTVSITTRAGGRAALLPRGSALLTPSARRRSLTAATSLLRSTHAASLWSLVHLVPLSGGAHGGSKTRSSEERRCRIALAVAHVGGSPFRQILSCPREGAPVVLTSIERNNV